MSNNQLDNFEKFLKNSLENNEVQYDPSDWDALNKRLNAKAKPFYKSNWFYAASVITGIATVCAIYFSSVNNENKTISDNDKQSHPSEISSENNNVSENKNELTVNENNTTIKHNNDEEISVEKENYNFEESYTEENTNNEE